jgi:hypothetical protein
MNRIWLVPLMISSAVCIFPPAKANAGLCDYPAVLTGATVFATQGAYCDWPTEIKALIAPQLGDLSHART